MPQVVHRKAYRAGVVRLVLCFELLQCGVVDVDAEVAHVWQGHIGHAETKLVVQLVTRWVLVAIEHGTQLGLRVHDLPIVHVEELHDQPAELLLQVGHGLVVLEVLRGGQ